MGSQASASLGSTAVHSFAGTISACKSLGEDDRLSRLSEVCKPCKPSSFSDAS